MPRKPTPIHYQGAVIYRQGAGYLAAVARPHGQGRARVYRARLEDLKAYIRQNAAEIHAGADPITPAELAEYRAAKEILPSGISLIEAARIAAAGAKTITPITTGQAIEEFLQSRTDANLRKSTRRDYKSRLRHLLPLAGEPLASITPKTLRAAIGTTGAAETRNSTKANCSTFFRWAITQGYLTTNPADGIPRVRRDNKLPAIYTPAQIAALLHTAEKTDPAAVPWLAIEIFTGTRSSALYKLTTESFRDGEIFIPGPADKLRLGYATPIHPTLAKWLNAYPPSFPLYGQPKREWRGRLKAIHTAARVPKIPKAFRHTLASYRLAATKNALETAEAIGHRGETKTLFAHYRALATAKEAAAFFAITPTKPVKNLSNRKTSASAKNPRNTKKAQ